MYAIYGNRNYQYTKQTVDTIRNRFDQASDPSLSLYTLYDDAFGVFSYWTFNLARQMLAPLTLIRITLHKAGALLYP